MIANYTHNLNNTNSHMNYFSEGTNNLNPYNHQMNKITNSYRAIHNVIHQNNFDKKINQKFSTLIQRVTSFVKKIFCSLDQFLNPLNFLGAEAATVKPSIQKKSLARWRPSLHWLG